MAQLIVRFVYYLLQALTWAIVIRSLLSWIPNLSPDNPLVRVLNQITEPLLAPARRIIRPRPKWSSRARANR